MPSCLRQYTLVVALVLVYLSPLDAISYDVECKQKSWWSALIALCICEPCAFCHYDFSASQCVASERPAIPASSSSQEGSIKLRQPVLDVDAWFLTKDEITASRGGVERSDLHTWSSGNHIDLFTSSDKFFASVDADVEAVDHDPAQIYVTSWAVADVPFLPRSPNWNASRVSGFLGRAMDRGVNVSVLVWSNVFERSSMVELQTWMNAHNSSRGTWLFDNRLPYVTSSHHQKSVTILPGAKGTPTTYVGGIDLTRDRWDTRYHNQSKLRLHRGIAKSYDGWIDASLRIQGPAVHDVASNFVARWNAKRRPLQEDEEILEFTNPEYAPITPLLGGRSDQNGSARIQITRTFSCKTGYEFAPRGEISLFRSRLKALRLAKNFIYIEDQYFIHVPVLQKILLEKLADPEFRALVVVTQMPALGTTVAGYELLLYRMVKPLADQFPDKVHIFAPRSELDLYVHSKVVIIDDVFLSVGSGNWNRRSMTSDSEMTANVIDRDTNQATPDGILVAKLARSFRIQKFSEFSGLSIEQVDQMSFLDAVHALDQSASNASGDGIVSGLRVVDELYFSVYPDGFEDQVDPEDVC